MERLPTNIEDYIEQGQFHQILAHLTRNTPSSTQLLYFARRNAGNSIQSWVIRLDHVLQLFLLNDSPQKVFISFNLLRRGLLGRCAMLLATLLLWRILSRLSLMKIYQCMLQDHCASLHVPGNQRSHMLETGGSVSDMEPAVAADGVAAAAVHIVRRIRHIAEKAAAVVCWSVEIAIAGLVGMNILAACEVAWQLAGEPDSYMAEQPVRLDPGTVQ